MADETPFKAYGDILAVTGKYTKDGKEKNRYTKVGVLFATPHFSRISIKLDAVPITGEGWLNVYLREDKDGNTSGYDSFKAAGEKLKDEVVEVDPNEPISLDDIPF